MDPRIVYFYTNKKNISILHLVLVIQMNNSVRVIKIEDFIIQKNNRLYGPYGSPIIMISGFELYIRYYMLYKIKKLENNFLLKKAPVL